MKTLLLYQLQNKMLIKRLQNYIIKWRWWPVERILYLCVLYLWILYLCVQTFHKNQCIMISVSLETILLICFVYHLISFYRNFQNIESMKLHGNMGREGLIKKHSSKLSLPAFSWFSLQTYISPFVLRPLLGWVTN